MDRRASSAAPKSANTAKKNRGVKRQLTYGEAIREGLYQAMETDPGVVVIGEGVPDPKAIFETTRGLREKFGADRVLDMPLAENGMTGVCIGAAMCGVRPVMVHQRIDFALLAMDQLINNAAKWHYLFNGQGRVPLVVRVLVGRGWGQGPQHAQSLQALFAHIPGIKVVLPTMAGDAKGMLLEAIQDDNPVVIVEHRWLYNIRGLVPQKPKRERLDRARLIQPGKHVTVAAFSYMVVEALAAAKVLAEYGVELEVIDMRSARPLDMEPVLDSLVKTGLLMVLDIGWATCGVSAEVSTRAVEEGFEHLRKPPKRVTLPDHPVPTSHHLSVDYYPDAETIAREALVLLDKPLPDDESEEVFLRLHRALPRDVPNPDFTGPF
ncbi:MAG: alpha-ketoacid dehydrogenase subunit beta [Magnetococcales bacterium]|nr:alpha-ketoacid dehydrogenase subunit beta [Magnetococcales bacterium]